MNATRTRATDPDSEGRVVQLVRASWFALVTPGLLTIIFTTGCWWAAGITGKVETIIATQSADHEQASLTKQDVASLKDTRAKRDAELAAIHSDLDDLKVQIAIMKATRNESSRNKP